jgi:hypothetical protein
MQRLTERGYQNAAHRYGDVADVISRIANGECKCWRYENVKGGQPGHGRGQ